VLLLLMLLFLLEVQLLLLLLEIQLLLLLLLDHLLVLGAHQWNGVEGGEGGGRVSLQAEHMPPVGGGAEGGEGGEEGYDSHVAGINFS